MDLIRDNPCEEVAMLFISPLLSNVYLNEVDTMLE